MSSKELTQVKFRLNAEELEVWQQKANERNMTLPKFSKQIVNQVITQGKLKQPKIKQERGDEVITHLARLGDNVNQIAKWCNMNKNSATSTQIERLEYNLERVQKELELIWQQLK